MGAQVIVVDTDQTCLERATELLGTVEPPASFEARTSDGTHVPIDDAVASRVVCTEVIEHVDDPAQLMRELVRIGKPGALYLLSCPDNKSEAIFKRVASHIYFERPNRIHIISQDEFARLVEEAGLVIEQRHNYGFYWLMWWMMLWICPEEASETRSALFEGWTKIWALLLDQPKGLAAKQALDNALPKSQIIIARKP